MCVKKGKPFCGKVKSPRTPHKRDPRQISKFLLLKCKAVEQETYVPLSQTQNSKGEGVGFVFLHIVKKTIQMSKQANLCECLRCTEQQLTVIQRK